MSYETEDLYSIMQEKSYIFSCHIFIYIVGHAKVNTKICTITMTS